MDSNRQVSVGSVLQSVAQMLRQNQTGLNNTSQAYGGGNHGDRVAQAFEAAAQAAQQSGTNDAGQQFQVAAQALKQNGQGKAIQYYSNGLQQAAQQFQGKQGLSASDLLPLLQSLAGGAQQGNPMQPGQGSMLDALLPAVQSFQGAQNNGMDEQQAALHALGSAVSGAQNTSRSRGAIDPGAASATNIIGGIVGALLPGLLSSLMSGALSGGGRQSQSQGQQGQNPLSGLLGGGNANSNDPLGGLGGLLGGLGGMLGGEGGQQGGQAQNPLEGLLGGGGQNPLSGLFGGNRQGSQQRDKSDFV